MNWLNLIITASFFLVVLCGPVKFIEANGTQAKEGVVFADDNDLFEAETFAQLAISKNQDEELQNLPEQMLSVFKSFCIEWRDHVATIDDQLTGGSIQKEIFNFYFDIADIYELSNKKKGAANVTMTIKLTESNLPKEIKIAFLETFSNRPEDKKVIRSQLGSYEAQFGLETIARELIEQCKTVVKLRSEIETSLANYLAQLKKDGCSVDYTLNAIPCMTMSRIVFIDEFVCEFAKPLIFKA